MIEIKYVNIEENPEAFWMWCTLIVEMSKKNDFYAKELTLMLHMRMAFQNTIYIALEDSVLRAYALIDTGDDDLMIAFMLVDAEHRRKLIGKKLLFAIIQNNPEVSIYTETEDRKALSFFSGCNFKLDKQRTKKGDRFLTLKYN